MFFACSYAQRTVVVSDGRRFLTRCLKHVVLYHFANVHCHIPLQSSTVSHHKLFMGLSFVRRPVDYVFLFGYSALLKRARWTILFFICRLRQMPNRSVFLYISVRILDLLMHFFEVFASSSAQTVFRTSNETFSLLLSV
jgi:hypothetical protein